LLGHGHARKKTGRSLSERVSHCTRDDKTRKDPFCPQEAALEALHCRPPKVTMSDFSQSLDLVQGTCSILHPGYILLLAPGPIPVSREGSQMHSDRAEWKGTSTPETAATTDMRTCRRPCVRPPPEQEGPRVCMQPAPCHAFQQLLSVS
jgi:hypothetical protein